MHCQLQKLIPQPYHLNFQTKLVYKNTNYSKPVHTLYQLFSLFGILSFLLPAVAYRVIWLIIHWKSYTSHNVGQIILYGSFLSVLLICLPFSQIIFKHSCLILTCVNKLNDLIVIHELSQDTKHFINIRNFRAFPIKEIFIFRISILFVLVSPILFVTPFILSYMTAQLIFGNIVIVQLCSSIFYGALAMYGSLSALCVLLIAIIFLEAISQFSIKKYC